MGNCFGFHILLKLQIIIFSDMPMINTFKAFIYCPTEQQVLSFSIWVTMILAALGVAFGLISGSQSITFDAVFSIIDASMSILSLVVARLLAKQHTNSKRFQYGYWHFEPLVATFNGAILLLSCVYAFLNAVRSLHDGGNVISFGAATIYASLVCLVCFIMYFYEKRANRRLQSELVNIDIHSFLMSAFITLALFLGFATAEILVWMGFNRFEPYADAVILLILVGGMFPIPLGIVRRALREVLLIAPPDLDQEVKNVMKQFQARYGFCEYKTYVAKTGRLNTIDIMIRVPDNFPATIQTLDGIRKEIETALKGSATLDKWLSIAFTANKDWI